jgi:hypothetical protein
MMADIVINGIVGIVAAPVIVGLVAIWYRMCWWAIRDLWRSYSD